MYKPVEIEVVEQKVVVEMVVVVDWKVGLYILEGEVAVTVGVAKVDAMVVGVTVVAINSDNLQRYTGYNI